MAKKMLPTDVVIFDHALRTSEETSWEIINLAVDMGWQDADAAHLVDVHHPTVGQDDFCGQDDCVIRQYHPDTNKFAYHEALMDVAHDASDSAEEYLNDHHVPEGYWAGNEYGAFGVWEVEE